LEACDFGRTIPPLSGNNFKASPATRCARTAFSAQGTYQEWLHDSLRPNRIRQFIQAFLFHILSGLILAGF
jgi:hypothetical protein